MGAEQLKPDMIRLPLPLPDLFKRKPNPRDNTPDGLDWNAIRLDGVENLRSKSIEEKRALVDTEMNRLLDRYLPKRRPISFDDYQWSQMQPEKVNPVLRKSTWFVNSVESNAQAAGANILGASVRNGVTWLGRFDVDAWEPEEIMHGQIFREWFIRSGLVSEDEIDTQIQKVRDRGLPIGQNFNDLETTAYGWPQETVGMYFYQSMINYAKQSENGYDPVLVKILTNVMSQENFHRYVHFMGLKAKLKYFPERFGKDVVHTLVNFQMPGHHMCPELQAESPLLAKEMGLPVGKLKRELRRGIVEIAGKKGLTQVALALGAKKVGDLLHV